MNWLGIAKSVLTKVLEHLNKEKPSSTGELPVPKTEPVVVEKVEKEVEDVVDKPEGSNSYIFDLDPESVLGDKDLIDMLERLLREAMFKKNYSGKKIIDRPFKKALLSFSQELVDNSIFSEGLEISDQPLAGYLQVLLNMKNSGEFVFLEQSRNGFNNDNDIIKQFLNSFYNDDFPSPIAQAILKQESNVKWFKRDNYPIVGLDFNDKNCSHKITSRGLFLSQRTIFHYPIGLEEFKEYSKLENDINFLFSHLKSKYEKFVISDNAKQRDDLRAVSFKNIKTLRPCQFDSSDERYFKDCSNCLKSINKRNFLKQKSVIRVPGKWLLKPTIYHKEVDYKNVPDYTKFPCDYLFSIRRYNGSGINSFHYLMKVIKHLINSF